MVRFLLNFSFPSSARGTSMQTAYIYPCTQGHVDNFEMIENVISVLKTINYPNLRVKKFPPSSFCASACSNCFVFVAVALFAYKTATGLGFSSIASPLSSKKFFLSPSRRKLFSSISSYCDGDDRFAGSAFYPPIGPYDMGYLKVSDIHTISYSVFGNPNGKPVLFVHGGPGGGTDPCQQFNFLAHQCHNQ